MRSITIPVLVLAIVGCGGWSGSLRVPDVPPPAVPERAEPATMPLAGPVEPVVPGQPIGLDQLIALAEEHNPDLAIARARTEAARGRLIQSGLYPNPSLIWEADEVGQRRRSAGTQGPILSQTFVTAGKLKIARAAAELGLAATDWQAMTRWYEVVTRVRLAYFEVLTARGEEQVAGEVLKLAEDNLQAARKLQKAGAGTQPDVLRAEVEAEQGRLRQATARQRATASWKLLATAVGVPDLPQSPLSGTLDGDVPKYEWVASVCRVLTQSSEVQEAQALVGQAERLVARAQAERVPDFKLSVRPFYSFPDDNMQVKVEAGATLPLFNRNQGNIVAARADLDRTEQEVRQVELRLTDRLTSAFQRYRVARGQAEAYRKNILPSAKESLRLVRSGYDRGDARYDYTAVLQAQNTLAQARVAYVQALGNLWRAVSEISGLLQE